VQAGHSSVFAGGFGMSKATPARHPFGSKAWRRVKSKALLRSEAFQGVASALLAVVFRLVHGLNRDVSPALAHTARLEAEGPAIIAMWHGRHFLTPLAWPNGIALDALISKSADAEINARILKRFDIGVVRGSGGREEKQNLDRGGAKALLELRRSLQSGRNVAMIADISHREAKQAGEGIIALARLTGRPIIPVAYTTSLRKVVKSSWDQAHINLPFGKRALIVGQSIMVTQNDDAEAARQVLTEALNEVTRLADQAVGVIEENPRTNASKAMAL
jgi:lysophospholipid acyltransferase (LPLAT)-like uncharacterized protein